MGGSGQGIFGKGAPAPPNYSGAAQSQAGASQANTQSQTQANRADQSSPFASTNWTFNPQTGQWSQSNTLNGPLGQAGNELEQQAAANFGTPLDTGTQARDKAITAAYNQATSRLDPRFAQQDEALKAQEAQQGLDPNSEAARTANEEESRTKNDAYQQAMEGAIGQGTAAQEATFGENMAARNAPLQEMAGLEGLMKQPGYANAGRAESPQDLAAQIALGNYELPATQMTNQSNADIIGGFGQLFSSFIPYGMGGQ